MSSGDLELAGVQRLLRLLDAHLGRTRPDRPREALDERLDLALRQSALKPVRRLAVLEGVDHRDGLDAQLLRQRLVLVDIDLDETHGARGRLHHLFQNGRQLLAGLAPGRPEVDDHRHVPGRLDHIGHEALGIAVLDEIAAAGGRFLFAQKPR